MKLVVVLTTLKSNCIYCFKKQLFLCIQKPPPSDILKLRNEMTEKTEKNSFLINPPGILQCLDFQ